MASRDDAQAGRGSAKVAKGLLYVRMYARGKIPAACVDPLAP
eukprot:COSAG05_NODE_3418_length_2078_cov_1.326427_3_plen_41_part_01